MAQLQHATSESEFHRGGDAALSASGAPRTPARQADVRTSLAYIDNSIEPEKSCTRCQPFIASPAGNRCGR